MGPKLPQVRKAIGFNIQVSHGRHAVDRLGEVRVDGGFRHAIQTLQLTAGVQVALAQHDRDAGYRHKRQYQEGYLEQGRRRGRDWGGRRRVDEEARGGREEQSRAGLFKVFMVESGTRGSLDGEKNSISNNRSVILDRPVSATDSPAFLPSRYRRARQAHRVADDDHN